MSRRFSRILGRATFLSCLLAFGFVGARAWAATTPYTLADVALHSVQADCWTAISGQVYNITPLMNTHTGKASVLVPTCGKDGTSTFNGQHGGVARILNIMNSTYQIGLLVAAQVPGAPTGVTATAANASAIVNWVAPASAGTSPITGYTVTSAPGARTCTTTGALTCTVTGLTNGTAYTFTVKATSAAGSSAASTASNSVTPIAIPSAPTGVTATRGDGSLTASWVAAVTNGATLTGYTATAAPGGANCSTTTALTCNITGLTNGTSYTVTVVAKSASGNSPASASSAAVVPAGVPSAPTAITATRGDASATVGWAASSPNGDPITGYTATSTPGNFTCTTTGLTCIVTGLTNGTSYTFKVVATNTAGSSAASASSAAVVPAAGPTVPTGITVTAGDTQVTVAWNASNGNGSAVTGYTVTSTPDSKTCTTATLTCNVAGLTNGTSYTFKVVAISAVSQSAPSVASAAVTPSGKPIAPVTVTLVRGNRQLVVSWTAAGANGSPITAYVAAATPGGATCTPTVATPLSCTIPNLTNGQAYTAVVTATNANGSTASAASAPATPATNPSTPTTPSATRGDTTATVTWAAPADNGAPIVGYTVTAAPSGITCASATTSCTVTGLVNGTSYTFTVIATNAVGNSTASAASNTVIPAGVPTAPTFVTSLRGDQSARVDWVASLPNGSALTGYTVTSTPGNKTCTAAANATTCTVTGLTNGTAYTFVVIGTNAVGSSLASNPSFEVIPAGVPTTPTGVIAVAADGQATVSWLPATGNGVALAGYTVTSSPDGLTCGAAPVPPLTCIVTGLRNGVSYTFTVTASNEVGTSAASVASVGVVPAGVPLPPTGVVAVRGDREANVSWVASADNGAAVTLYTVTASPGGAFCTTSVATSCTVLALTNNISYTFTVKATNRVGVSADSAASAAIIPAGLPTSPTLVSATFGAQSATVSWAASNPNGDPISLYTVTANPGGATCTSPTTSCVVSGLLNGTSYIFTVTATNGVGTSVASGASAPVVPASQPDRPTSVVATAGDGQATVTWTAPADNGRPITGYVVTALPGGVICNSTTTSCKVVGLNNGWSYNFTVVAINAVNPSAASDFSNAVIPAGKPVAPSGIAAVRGDGQAIVSWFSSYANGSPVTGYTVTASPGGATCSTVVGVDLSPTSCIFANLTNGTAYTFTVTAENAVGVSAASLPSSAVIPAGLPGPATNVTGVRGNGQVTVSWTAADGNGLAISTYTVRMVGGGQVCSVTTTSCVVPGLTNGTTYSFTVLATTDVGDAPVSDPSAPVTPAGLPTAPTGVLAVRGDTEATISWQAAFGNGEAILGYTVTSTPGGLQCTSGSTTCTVIGLTNGTSYTFKVTATNAVGNSPASAASLAVVPAGVPTPPLSVTAQRGNQEASVSWLAPASNNGAVVTAYLVMSTPDGLTCSTSQLSCTVTGLTNGVAYTFIVKALNNVGASAASSASSAVTPAALPTTPTGVVGIRGNQQVAVSWNAPASDGGSAISGYRVTANPGAGFCETAETSCTITGLKNGTTYSFVVVATNAVGDSLPSAPSVGVKPAAVPDAPTAVVGTRGDQQVVLTWTAGADNGEPIVAFTAVASPGGLSCSSSSTTCTITGLTNGTSYTFSVSAFNAVGTSSVSAASGIYVPAAKPDAPTSVAAVRGSTTATISWTPGSDHGEQITEFVVRSTPGDFTCTTKETSCTVSGLTNGTSYTFTVTATNAVGVSPISAASNAVIPARTPDAPTGVTATRGAASATISWTEAVGNGEAVTSYVVTSTPDSLSCTSSTTSCTITGLTNGTSYTFTVIATNALGSSIASEASAAVTPAAAPTAVQTAKGVSNAPKRVTLSWARVSGNGDAVITYEYAWRKQGSATWTAWISVGESTKVTLTGWLKGKNYQFKVRATNSAGRVVSKNFIFKPVK